MKSFRGNQITCLYTFLIHIATISCLIHHLELNHDRRSLILLSSFGFLDKGILQVNVHNFTFQTFPYSEYNEQEPNIGFMLTRSDSHRDLANYEESFEYSKDCPFYGKTVIPGALLSMTLHDNERKVKLNCVNGQQQPLISSLEDSNFDHDVVKRDTFQANVTAVDNLWHYEGLTKNTSSFSSSRKPSIVVRVDDSLPELRESIRKSSSIFRERCPRDSLPLEVHRGEQTSYSFNFSMHVNSREQQGSYSLILFNCNGGMHQIIHHNRPVTKFDINITINEVNYPHNFLSAGEIPLPHIYFFFSVMFFMTSAIWINLLLGIKHSVVKIHHLMSCLIVAKAFTLLFHAINYHYISLKGSPDVIWAYLFYATRSMKGALFFITLILIGSGWSVIKHILSDKDKKIILIIIPMQILAHVAETIIDETSQGAPSKEFWTQICIFIDLLCCVAILYPISWSIRHLSEASRTDGKAAINLKKLELFKRFYIISTIYIYITRIVAFVFMSMLTFSYTWLAMCFYEFATFIYFLITGYYFRPLPSNPYTLLAGDLDLDEEVVFSLDDTNNEKIVLADEIVFNVNSDTQNASLLNSTQRVTRRVVDDVV